jgi:hypothetical protein
MIRLSATHNLFLSLLCLTLVSAPIALHSQMPAGPNRPAAVPEGYLITPMGYFHPSCVKHVAKDDVLHPDEMAIQHGDGSFDAMPTCAYPHYTAKGEVVPLDPSDNAAATAKGEKVALGPSADAKTDDPPFIGHSWMEAIYAETSSSYGKITTEFKVPPGPASWDGQTIYFFPGMQDYKGVKTIIQPVLGWGADSTYAHSWSISSWNCCTKGTVYVSPLEPTKSGDTIYGEVVNQCSAGTLECGQWTIYTTDKTTGAWTKLWNESNFGQTFNWGFGAVLEVYNITRCSDYPSGGKLESYDVDFYNDKFQKISSPTWYLWKLWPGLSPQCGYGGYLDTSSGSEMTLTY